MRGTRGSLSLALPPVPHAMDPAYSHRRTLARRTWPSPWLPRSHLSSGGLVAMPLAAAAHSLMSERLRLMAEITGGDGAEG
jgi:hypothetical protein